MGASTALKLKTCTLRYYVKDSKNYIKQRTTKQFIINVYLMDPYFVDVGAMLASVVSSEGVHKKKKNIETKQIESF